MNSERGWQTVFREKVNKDISKFPIKDQKKIVEAIYVLSENPFWGDIQKIAGEPNNWRKRIGSYRIFYEIFTEDKIVYISKIKRRSSNTY